MQDGLSHGEVRLVDGRAFDAMYLALCRWFGIDQVERISHDGEQAHFGVAIGGVDYTLTINRTP